MITTTEDEMGEPKPLWDWDASNDLLFNGRWRYMVVDPGGRRVGSVRRVRRVDGGVIVVVLLRSPAGEILATRGEDGNWEPLEAEVFIRGGEIVPRTET